ncbi:MAG: hypothetical protein JW925_12805 [Syntrophaceae bacterium]|nr:hypothetical protein [Syntrophaceae bacterium]
MSDPKTVITSRELPSHPGMRPFLRAGGMAALLSVLIFIVSMIAMVAIAANGAAD